MDNVKFPVIIKSTGYWRPSEIDVWPYGHDAQEYYVMIEPVIGNGARRTVCVGIVDTPQLAALLSW